MIVQHTHMYMYAQCHTCLYHAPHFFPHSPVLSPLMYVHVCRFTAIACTHTSLLAVDGRGFLCCWDWAHTMPHPSTEVGHAHPRAVKLVLGGECVALMDASYVRATIMATSGKVMCTP